MNGRQRIEEYEMKRRKRKKPPQDPFATVAMYGPDEYGVESVAMTEGNMGCPHEEGPDFPHGEDCPFFPFWKGKQGSNRKD
jgi:hypothetical protein